MPDVAPVVASSGLIRLVADAVGTGGAALVLHEEASEPLATAVLPAPGDAVDVLVVVGPEGGIAPEELDALIGAGARAVRLGPEVLRTSSAGPVALAVLSVRLGRWA